MLGNERSNKQNIFVAITLLKRIDCSDHHKRAMQQKNNDGAFQMCVHPKFTRGKQRLAC